MKKKIILFSSIAFFLVACTYDKGPVSMVKATDDCKTPDWYATTIEPIINTKCATSTCHDAGSGNGDLTSYAGVKLYVDNGTFKNRVLILGDMPKAPGDPLSDSEKSKIDCWLSNGAPNGTTVTTPTPTVTPTVCNTTISYTTTIAPLIATNCAISGCHNSGSVDGDYTAFAGLKIDAANGQLNSKVVVTKAMPKFPVLPLSNADINAIDCWIRQGALNN